MGDKPATQRRGDRLRRDIALAAKDVFLELGFERASMDAVAARAQTSKRSLYAHYPSKDVLLGAVVETVRELYLERLGHPEDYAADRREAVVLFCGRFIQLMTWHAQVAALRLVVSEAERVPELGRTYFDGVIVESGDRLAAHLAQGWGIPAEHAPAKARDLLSRVAMPAVVRVLLTVEPAIPGATSPTAGRLAQQVDLAAVRAHVEEELDR